MGISIDLVADTSYEKTDNGVLDSWRKHHPSAIPVLTVRHATDTVLAKSASATIDVLRIFGHGAPGQQWVGAGFNGDGQDMTRQNAQAIRFQAGVLRDQSLLARLAGRFSAGAVVELHGCSVGQSPAGQGLARSLAQLWNVRVLAGTHLQYADPKGSLEGGFIEALPNGIIRSFTSGVPGFVLIPPPPPPAPPPAPPSAPLIFHQVGAVITRDDWLSVIAQKHYGDMLLWPIIYDKNIAQLPQGPNKVKPHQKLEIPPISGYKPEQLKEFRKRGYNWRI